MRHPCLWGTVAQNYSGKEFWMWSLKYKNNPKNVTYPDRRSMWHTESLLGLSMMQKIPKQKQEKCPVFQQGLSMWQIVFRRSRSADGGWLGGSGSTHATKFLFPLFSTKFECLSRSRLAFCFPQSFLYYKHSWAPNTCIIVQRRLIAYMIYQVWF